MKKLVSVLLVALMVLVCFGCANQQAPANQPGGTATTAPDTSAPSSPPEQTDAPSGAPVRESLVRMGHDSTPYLDPAAHIATVALVASCNLYETLIFPTEEGFDPFLAESWEVSDDGMEYIFKIKEGVLFHDGSELKASDVAFSANRFIAIGEGYAFVYTSVLEKAEAIDDYHVKFILKVPFGPFLSSLGRLYIMNEEEVMAHAKDGPYGEFGDYGKDWLISHDAGSGPYKAVELVQQDYFLAEKFKDWHMGWEDRPYAPEKFMLLYATEPSTVRTMMETQTLEISDQWQSNEAYEMLDALDGISLAYYSTRMMQIVYFNNSLPPTDDVNVRKALACVFDYDTLINTVFPGSQLCNGPISKLTAGYAEATRYPFDIEKAKEYIAMSKYADNLADYPLNYMVLNESGTHEKIALAVQAAAKQAGFNIQINKEAWVRAQEALTKMETTPHILSIATSPAFNEAGSGLEAQFHSKTQGTVENGNWMGGILDKEIDDAMTTLDKAERFKKYADIQKKVTDEICPCVWVADVTERVAYQDTYISLPAVEAGRITANLMGYTFYVPDIKIYTDR